MSTSNYDNPLVPEEEDPHKDQTRRHNHRTIRSAHLSALDQNPEEVEPEIYWEQQQLGKLLSRPARAGAAVVAGADTATEENPPPPRGPSVVCISLQVAAAAMGVFLMGNFPTLCAGYTNGHVSTHAKNLIYIASVPLGFGWAALILPIGNARENLQPGGVLEQLLKPQGKQPIKLSHRDVDVLFRWRVWFLACLAVWILLSIFLIISGIFEMAPLVPQKSPLQRRIFFIVWGMFTIPAAIMCHNWWSSLFTAHSICRSSIIKTIRKSREIKPANEAWRKDVADPAFGLIEKMTLMSQAAAGGVFGGVVFFWLNALVFLPLYFNTAWCDALDAANGYQPGSTRTVC
eukprot:COSAG01_NODE_4799_length_4735_cov_22.441976_7_plen_345_part_01